MLEFTGLNFGGGGRTRTYDLRIMSASPPTENKADQQLSSEEPGKIRQDPQPGRNQNGAEVVITNANADADRPLPDGPFRRRK